VNPGLEDEFQLCSGNQTRQMKKVALSFVIIISCVTTFAFEPGENITSKVRDPLRLTFL